MSRSILLRFFLPFAIGTMLAACAGRPEPPDVLGEEHELRLEGGYQAAVHVPVQGWDAEWQVDGQSVEVSWLAPERVGAKPLILYLPGLGEGSRGGAYWRRAWAEAGYAVLSVQPKPYGRAVYSSPEAQVGVFRPLARRSFSEQALAGRIAVLGLVLDRLRSRAQAGDSDLADVDWQALVVAGFDLGAQTAATLAGERVAGSPALPGWQPKAAILLSPYVAEEDESERFGQIDTPLLAFTGPDDEDPFGWVEPPLRRQRLWQGLQVSGSYQLIAAGASHRMLGGSFDQVPKPQAGERGGRRAQARPARTRDSGSKGGRSSSGSPGERSAGGAPGGGGRPGGGMGGRPDQGSGVGMGHGEGLQERIDPRQMARLVTLSLAFLDARVRAAAPAQRWLEHDAALWLAPSGRLERKP